VQAQSAVGNPDLVTVHTTPPGDSWHQMPAYNWSRSAAGRWCTTSGRGQPLSLALLDCSSSLAKFRGLMYGVKHSAVIGREIRSFLFLYVPSMSFQAVLFLSHRCIFTHTSNLGISPNDSANVSGW